jgi:hypothetical protein
MACIFDTTMEFGTWDIVKFLGADFVYDMQIKYSIKLSNDTVILVDLL